MISRPLCFIIALVLTSIVFAADPAPQPRERLRMDAGWRFAFGHPFEPKKDFEHALGYFSYLTKAGYGDGPAAAKFDDRGWRSLDLPHDWAVEAPFAANGSHSHGYKAVGRNFPERSVGWYRKTFRVPASDLGRRISVEFDGVFRDSVVWVNGFYLGRQPSGYSGFCQDLTDYLNYGGENVIAVRADVTMEEGWFYEGAGIYRHVWLTKTSPLHVATWGTFVTTEVREKSAGVAVRATVVNESSKPASFEIEHRILDPKGIEIAREEKSGLMLAAGISGEFSAALSVTQPQLWSLETPALHRVVTTIRSGGAIVDRYETTLGIRTIRFDPDHGFFLNGKHVLLLGTNNHQDHAGVGVAVPDALLEFRIRRLKEMGNNAYRCAHHPPAPELLEICDRLGVLVLDETRLMGPSPEQMSQLEAMVLRDRNHPSVILWSVGNEEWAIEGNPLGARISATMQSFVQRLDPTRRTTVAISGGWGQGSSTTADVMGYNYFTHGSTDEQHAKFPHQPGVGTEETTTQGTRGIYFSDEARSHLAPQMKGDSGGNCLIGWQHFAARPYLAGLFFWTGFDYRGESNPYSFPAISSQYGLMDTCGFPKDSYYYLQSWWTAQPVLHVFPHWNWPDRVGQELTVGCYSNHEAVELFLNGVSLGRKAMPRNDRLEWKVAYQPGVLEARGYRDGKVVETKRVETTGAPAKLVVTSDRSTINADGEDVAVFTVEARDAQDRVVPVAGNSVDFEISGGRIIGVGNGDPGCHEPDQFNTTVAPLILEDWRGRIAPAGTASPSAKPLEPMTKLGNWKATLPATGELYDLSAKFSLEAVSSGVELFLPSFGAKTTVWVNGREVARDLDTSLRGPALRLDPAHLVAGSNRVQMIVTPFADKRNHIPETTRIGSVRLAPPTIPARRSLFNGFAQVIVQATTQPGEIRLVAKSSGLATAQTSVVAQPATPRPAVP
ncbi:MAG TPA: beta-galactosidase GalA [Opitutaceae bacterium]|nr:beta-galactosidase GalA [Opitutaceae bacterium]